MSWNASDQPLSTDGGETVSLRTGTEVPCSELFLLLLSPPALLQRLSDLIPLGTLKCVTWTWQEVGTKVELVVSCPRGGLYLEEGWLLRTRGDDKERVAGDPSVGCWTEWPA